MECFLRRSLSASSISLSTSDSFADEQYLQPQKYERTRDRHVRSSTVQWARIAKDVLLHLLAIIGLAAIIFHFIGTSIFSQASDPFTKAYDANFTAQYANAPCSCGSSVKEAISLGCVYDELSVGWLPPRCRDDALTAEFSALGDDPNGGWKYWADKNHTRQLSLEELSMYADTPSAHFHTSAEWHRQHCLFLWIKEHRMKVWSEQDRIEKGKIFDPRSDSELHIRHCIGVFNRPGVGAVGCVVLVG